MTVPDWRSEILVVSGFDDEGTGGLFTFDGSALERIDDLSCTGLGLDGLRVGRLLRAPVELHGATELVVYDRVGVLEYRRIDGVGDPHDLAPAGDGSWIVVSSSDNSVTRVAPDGSLEVLWHPSTAPDSWHPNAVAVVGGEVWVTAFGRFDDARGWSGEASRGAGFLRNLTTGEEYGGLSHPHSPRRVDGGWLVCNSMEGTVVARRPGGDRWECRVELERYPRGLVVDGRMLYVGESANRGDPDERSSLAVVEGDRVVDRVPLPCREIYDVVVAPVAALGGLRRGFNTNPHRMTGTSSDGLFGAVGNRELFAGLGRPLDPSAASTRVSCRTPGTMARSGVARIDVEVTNLAGTALGSALPYPVCLSYRWTDGAGTTTDGPRTALGTVLLPDETASYTIDLRAPETAGEYRLSVALVQDGICWLDATHSANGYRASVSVT